MLPVKHLLAYRFLTKEHPLFHIRWFEIIWKTYFCYYLFTPDVI